ncbi:MAG TPA: tRNA pseudouridine(55) synthase TruB [Actinomycetota bacterium]|nr:tRNA pseudouridine(55) synthase TruB [Actinomycetota bacterium]
MTDGVLLVDKPSGITSHDAVDAVRRALGVRRVGHAGTLDPMASGLLVLGVGRATRLLRFLGDLEKEYEGTGRLGEETDTLDATGSVVRTAPADVAEEDLRGAMASFIGDIEQRPPAYSAVKVGGRRLYRAARAGERVKAPPRRVRVDAFDLLGFDGRDFDFRAVCSSGTYVRSLVADLGTALGPGAHLTRLRRTRIGRFSVSDAVPADAPGAPLPIDRAVEHLRRVEVDGDEAEAARHGRCLAPAGVEGPYALVGPGGRVIGVWRDTGTKSCPDVVLAG